MTHPVPRPVLLVEDSPRDAELLKDALEDPRRLLLDL